jgi:hypothetical protein
MAVYQAALPEADYLVGFVDMLVNDALLQRVARGEPPLWVIRELGD